MCDGLTASSFLARGSLHRFVRAIIFCRGVVELINSRAAFFPCDYISVIAYVFSLILLHLSRAHSHHINRSLSTSTPILPPPSSSSPNSLFSQSPMASPTSPTSLQAEGAGSRSFFGAITDRVRGRSRSRSPQPPQNQMSPPASAAKLQHPKKNSSSPRPTTDRTASQSTTASTESTHRTSAGYTDRSQWETMSYGRHSSEV